MKLGLASAGSVVVCALALQAQTGNPLISEARQAYATVKKNIMDSAEKMPDENYAFKPTPEVRSFAEVLGHVRASQTGACAAVAGDKLIGDPSGGSVYLGSRGAKASKTDALAALKESFSECDKAFDSLNETTAVEMVASRRGQRSKLGMLMGITSHDNEQYGIMTVYLRLKGIGPPASSK